MKKSELKKLVDLIEETLVPDEELEATSDAISVNPVEL